MKPSKTQITKAGKTLLSSKLPEERNQALELINEWRTNHLYPLTLMRNTLAKLLDKNNIEPFLVSQRLKRLTSIEYKLDLNRNMALGGMQDIGGFRIVLKDTKDLIKLRKFIEQQKETKSYKIEYWDDYIAEPRLSGYRSIHYIYTVRSKNEKYDGLKLELQIRTKFQHNWATAVETAGIYTKTSLKSSKGPDNWLNFFKTVSSLFAIKEKLPVLEMHKDKTMHQLMVDCYNFSQDLNAIHILKGLRVSAHHIESDKIEGDYFIINISFKEKAVNIMVYKRRYFNAATYNYLKLEKEINDSENAVVFVSATSLKGLRKAYPSYFLDTSEFIAALEKMNSNCKEWGLLK